MLIYGIQTKGPMPLAKNHRVHPAKNGITTFEMANIPSGTNKPNDFDETKFDPKLYNEDLKPLRSQTWNTYNIFAVWMSDVHSVAGYLTAGSLFSLRLAGWQVFVALILGILIVQFCCNLVAKPSQVTGVPYPVINRAIFGIRGANIPALLRGSIAIAWYGVQTYLASKALVLVLLKFFPGLNAINNVQDFGFLGLSLLGWCSFSLLWATQAALFWKGMDAIRRFIDWAGPAVYLVMMALAIYLVARAGPANLSMNLSQGASLGFPESIPVMLSAVALVVSYFSGPMLNFGDFSRYARSWPTVKLGNLLGLPLNFLFFSVLTVLITSATLPVFGQVITDPIDVMDRIGTPVAVIVGGLTFVVATVGINIVANFISPAFDFSNLAPQYISWRAGGMITAICSVLLTPWNWYNNPTAIHFTLDILGALIGPLHGILISGYYIASKQRVWVSELYSSDPRGPYWFVSGFNPNAVVATAISGALSIVSVVLPKLLAMPRHELTAGFSWFVGCLASFCLFTLLERIRPRIILGPNLLKEATDGTKIEGNYWKGCKT